MLRIALSVFAFALLAGCGRVEESRLEDFNTRPVTLPDGTRIQAETVTHQIDMGRGLMFRDSLPEGRGMLFIHGSPGKYSYWMYQVKMPLDIIWMDARGLVVEFVENAPPCKGPSSQCTNFGGNETALVVLELPGGTAKKHGVTRGALIRF
jgi:uncharacterized membrane protein (UPF0127 family)